MRRFVVFLLLLAVLVSCSKKDKGSSLPPVTIPDNINGTVYECNVTPVNVTTPDKGYLLVLMNGTLYKVTFNAIDSAQANAVLHVTSDSILTADSRESTNVGRDAVTYFPVAANQVEIWFRDGRKVIGAFDPSVTNFGGTFGEQVIAQWRDINDPAKPNQKAREDIKALIDRYEDNDGYGPGNTPTYLSVTVSTP